MIDALWSASAFDWNKTEPAALARAAKTLVGLAEGLAVARSESDGDRIAWGAEALGKAVARHAALASACANTTSWQAAVEALIAEVANDRASYGTATGLAQAASAQVYLGCAAPAFWQRLLRGGPDSGAFPSHLGGRQAASLLWARARLFVDGNLPAPDVCEWTALCACLRQGGPQPVLAAIFTSRDVAHTLWAGARVGHSFELDLQAALLDRLAVVVTDMKALDVSCSLYALGRLSVDVSALLRSALLARLHVVEPQMTAQAVSDSLRGLGCLQWRLAVDVQRALLARLRVVAPQMTAQEVACSMFGVGALSRMGARRALQMPGAILPPLCDAVAEQVGACTPQGVSDTMLGFAHMLGVVDNAVTVPRHTRAALASALARSLPLMSAQAIADSVWACGALRWQLDKFVCESLRAWLLEHAGELTAKPASHLLLGLADIVCTLAPAAVTQLLGAAEVALLDVDEKVAPLAQQQHAVHALFALAMLAEQGVRLSESFVLRVVSAVARVAPLHASGHRQVLDALMFLKQSGTTLPKAGEAVLARSFRAVQTSAHRACGLPGRKHVAVISSAQSLVAGSGEAAAEIESEALVCGGTRRVDILVTTGPRRVAIEVDGPTHFVRDVDGAPVGPDGRTRLRDALLRFDGLDVISVPVEGNAPAHFASPAFAAWLRDELACRGIYVGAGEGTSATGSESMSSVQTTAKRRSAAKMRPPAARSAAHGTGSTDVDAE